MRDQMVIWVTVLVCILVALLNVAAHWFPWAVMPGVSDARGRLRRVPAYVYGTATILEGMGVWALGLTLAGTRVVSPWVSVLVLGLVMLSAGAGTVGAYAVDAAREHHALVMDVADLEKRIGL